MNPSPTPSFCANCNHELREGDKFCSACGQDTHPKKIPFKHFISEFLEGTVHFDAKIWFTIKKLFINPGNVIREFNENKRARFVPPIRLYVFISFIYFLLAAGSVTKNVSTVKAIMSSEKIDDSSNFVVNVFSSTLMKGSTYNKLVAITNINEKQVDSVLKADKVKSTTLNNKVIREIVHLRRGEVNNEEFTHRFISIISKMVFVLMPLFAFLLWLICGPRKLFYSETLIFSLYFHSFYFFLLLIRLGLNYMFTTPIIDIVIYMVAAFYLFIAVKSAFEKSWGKTILQTIALIITYVAVFLSLFVLALTTSIIS